MRKGQTSIEFMIIILIVIVYLITVTRPIISSAQTSIEDIKNLTQTNNETLKILQTINRVSNFSLGTQETINLVIPKNSEIVCYDDGNIGFIVKINQEGTNPQTNKCPNNICDKNYYTNQKLDCIIQKLSGLTNLIIEKSNTSNPSEIKLRQS